MKSRVKTNTIALLFAATIALPVGVFAGGRRHTEELKVMVPVAEGIRLGTNIYTPTQVERGPVILIRTPYGSGSMPWAVDPFTKAGFIVVTQDVRGMGSSEGTFTPFLYDRDDGIKTLDWIAKQRWCDGNIGMWGSSYLAFCSLVVLPEAHPNLKAVFNLSGWGSSSEMATPGGAMHLMACAPWTLSGQISGQPKSGKATWDDAFRHIPVVDLPSVFGIESEQWRGMLSLCEGNELDQSAGIFDRCDKNRVPIYHLTGWHDFVGRNTIDTYECLQAHAKKNNVPQILRIGPWRHDQIWEDGEATVGDESFGPESVMGVKKVMSESVRWFDRFLKGNRNRVAKEKPVTIFVMGENKWHDFDAWPPASVEFQQWFMESRQGANSSSGDGRLSLMAPSSRGSDQFIFDPMDPVPTHGGANAHFFPDNLGVKDQRDIEKRDDVLVYTSTTLENDLVLVGPLQVVLYASSEGKTTDFTAKLVEVRSDGYARIIEEGILRGPDLVDGQKVKAMQPGKVYPFTIDLGATGIRIQQGHRVRVEVSSSNFPKYTRNPNTGENPERATAFRKVRQTIHHSAEFPSHILLPVLKN